MKKLLILMLIASLYLCVSSVSAVVIDLTSDAVNSTPGAWGTSIEATLTDPFSYDVDSPVDPLPQQSADDFLAEFFHANEAEGADVTLNYMLTGGTFTTTLANPTIVVDLYGRNESRMWGDVAEGTRDDDVDVVLLLGGVDVASVLGVQIAQGPTWLLERSSTRFGSLLTIVTAACTMQTILPSRRSGLRPFPDGSLQAVQIRRTMNPMSRLIFLRGLKPVSFHGVPRWPITTLFMIFISVQPSRMH